MIGPSAIWPIMADTARFNEAAALPKHEIEEIPRSDGSVLYLGRLKRGPLTFEWREKPVNWVTDQWFEHCREFRNGPLQSLCATLELAPEGIRVNALAPVAGETPLLAQFMGEDTPEKRAAFRSTIPLGRLSTPLDIANAALFLSSDDAAMVTGAVLEVDGGRCI